MGNYIDRNEIEEFPFDGTIYYTFIDESKPLNEQEEETVIVLETKCDIQESQKTDVSDAVKVSWNVYFPFSKKKGVEFKRGFMFRGSIYGLKVNGEIIGEFPTQMGICGIYLKDGDS